MEFKDNMALYLGYCESAIGFGLLIGPVIGSFVYGQFGFSGTFYFFSLLMAMMFMFSLAFLPSRLN